MKTFLKHGATYVDIYQDLFKRRVETRSGYILLRTAKKLIKEWSSYELRNKRVRVYDSRANCWTEVPVTFNSYGIRVGCEFFSIGDIALIKQILGK